MRADYYTDSAPSLISPDRGRQLINKWSKMLDFEDSKTPRVEGHHKRLSVAILLENQEKWLRDNGHMPRRVITENNVSGGTGGVFTGYDGSVNNGGYGGVGPGQYDYDGYMGSRPHPLDDVYAPGDARLPKTLIPMIRRTFPELIANELFGIQPMAGPVGLAFALRYVYESDNLACQGPQDGSCDPNGPTPAWRSDGVEAGYNFLNTAHTGITAEGLNGLNGTSASADWHQLEEDMGVAQTLSAFEFTNAIPQMTLTIEKTAVEPGTRRLATKFSLELEQDLRNMNGLEIDAEMTNVMSYELAAEIDRELIIRAIQVCLNAGTGLGYSLWRPQEADGRWFAERGVSFYAKVVLEANRLAIRNRRGAANFIVATPSVCTILTLLSEFKPFDITAGVDRHPMGIARVGSLGGQFNVYRDTRMEAQFATGVRTTRLEYALLGYKGAEFWDTGIVYCPYIPVIVQRTVGPNDFGFRVGMMTRYGVVDNLFGAQNFYHLIIAKDLDTTFETSYLETTPKYLS
jgi:hypothetical protein